MTERIVEAPWSCVSGDIIGPKPLSKSGKRYILVLQDVFTKFVEIKALRTANAKSIWQALDELVINRWGCPRIFISDNGTEFSNKYMTIKLQEAEIIQQTTPVYHAQANPTERTNRNLRSMISTYVKEDHREWDIHLHEFAFALNTAEHSSLKPSFL